MRSVRCKTNPFVDLRRIIALGFKLSRKRLDLNFKIHYLKIVMVQPDHVTGLRCPRIKHTVKKSPRCDFMRVFVSFQVQHAQKTKQKWHQRRIHHHAVLRSGAV